MSNLAGRSRMGACPGSSAVPGWHLGRADVAEQSWGVQLLAWSTPVQGLAWRWTQGTCSTQAHSLMTLLQEQVWKEGLTACT